MIAASGWRLPLRLGTDSPEPVKCDRRVISQEVGDLRLAEAQEAARRMFTSVFSLF